MPSSISDEKINALIQQEIADDVRIHDSKEKEILAKMFRMAISLSYETNQNESKWVLTKQLIGETRKTIKEECHYSNLLQKLGARNLLTFEGKISTKKCYLSQKTLDFITITDPDSKKEQSIFDEIDNMPEKKRKRESEQFFPSKKSSVSFWTSKNANLLGFINSIVFLRYLKKIFFDGQKPKTSLQEAAFKIYCLIIKNSLLTDKHEILKNSIMQEIENIKHDLKIQSDEKITFIWEKNKVYDIRDCYVVDQFFLAKLKAMAENYPGSDENFNFHMGLSEKTLSDEISAAIDSIDLWVHQYKDLKTEIDEKVLFQIVEARVANFILELKLNEKLETISGLGHYLHKESKELYQKFFKEDGSLQPDEVLNSFRSFDKTTLESIKELVPENLESTFYSMR